MAQAPSIKISYEVDDLRVEYLAKKALADALRKMRDELDTWLRAVRADQNALMEQIERRDGLR
jgi:hypothetical protein